MRAGISVRLKTTIYGLQQSQRPEIEADFWGSFSEFDLFRVAHNSRINAIKMCDIGIHSNDKWAQCRRRRMRSHTGLYIISTEFMAETIGTRTWIKLFNVMVLTIMNQASGSSYSSDCESIVSHIIYKDNESEDICLLKSPAEVIP